MEEAAVLKLLEKLKSFKDYVSRYENKQRFIGAHRAAILAAEKRKAYALKMLDEYTNTVQRESEYIEVGNEQIESAIIWCESNKEQYEKLKRMITDSEEKLLSQIDKIQDKIKESQDGTKS